MNFIAETNKYARLIETWKKGHGFSDRDALKDLAAIWDEFKNIPERKKVIYQGALGDLPKTDIGCSNCIFDMLTMVYNWRKILEHEVPQDIPNVPAATIETVDFKGVDSPEVKELKELEQQIIKDFDIQPTVVSGTNFDGMKMHQIRSIAKKARIPYTNKTTKEELIQLLSEKG
jgi:hypothetical protein